MKSLLFLCHRIPYPPNKGDKIRAYHFFNYLSRRYRVYLGTFVDDDGDWQYVSVLKTMCADCNIVSLRRSKQMLRSLTALLGKKPLTLPYYFDSGLQSWVGDLLASGQIERILIFSSAMAQYVFDSQGAELRKVVDFVDMDSEKWRQYSLSTSLPLKWLYSREATRLLDYEKQVTEAFDVSFFVSESEAELFRRTAPGLADKVSYVNNGVDTDYFSPDRDYPNPYDENQRVVVFTGAMDYRANIDAVSWFAARVFPEIRRRVADARFYIVGSRPANRVRQLSSQAGIEVTGAVDDIRPYIAHAQVAVAPMRIARGVQNKVLEAMAMAKPVVVSPQGLEGIYAVPDREVIVAGISTEEFTHCVQSALLNAGMASIGRAARARVVTDYSWDQSFSRLEGYLESGQYDLNVRKAANE